MSLIRFDDVSFGYGDQRILIEASLSLEPGERVCLIGRNGAGKSSTFRLIMGLQEVDGGDIVRAPDLIVSELRQELPDAMTESVRTIVRSGLADIERLLEHHQALAAQNLDAPGLRELEDLHQLIDAHGGWNLEQRVEATMTELDLPAEKRMNELSGGWRRRVMLARALVQKPDLLLLDEPTNHLDIATIKWLENVVYSYPGTVLFITHDRAFLDRLATRIVEIDRGKLSSWPGNFADYQRRKEKALEDESTENALFDKKLAQEEAWIRQGIKARRTRNEGRVRALMAMREKRAERVSPEAKARIHIEEADISGRKVIRARNVSYRYASKEPLIDGFSTTIMRGDRIGILGNNGVGKTTLLRLLLGEIEPQSGTIKLGTNLEIGYFDQLREKLDPEKSVAENVGDGKTYIPLNGKDRHVVGYLKGFLFDAERSLTPVKALSGGERNRVILAKLFTRPANLLVLDEPTNDLDMETLDVLEDKLTEFSGTLIVVSHDRRFLDNVVTSTIVFEEGGRVREYVGGYSDWVRQGHRLTEVENPHRAKANNTKTRRESATIAPKKLGYKEQRELDGLPGEIEALEDSIGQLERRLADPAFYSGDHAEVQTAAADLDRLQTQLDQRMERWADLTDTADAYERFRDSQRV
ncbi:MAG: ATP-binding cassette domain-containing protein [Pseudomonadota bacterium]